MANKLANLQNALNNTRPSLPTASSARSTRDKVPAIPLANAGQRQANRQDKVNVAAWLHHDFKSSLRLVQARRPGSIQDLMEEALNDLFAKYNVPQATRPNI